MSIGFQWCCVVFLSQVFCVLRSVHGSLQALDVALDFYGILQGTLDKHISLSFRRGVCTRSVNTVWALFCRAPHRVFVSSQLPQSICKVFQWVRGNRRLRHWLLPAAHPFSERCSSHIREVELFAPAGGLSGHCSFVKLEAACSCRCDSLAASTRPSVAIDL